MHVQIAWEIYKEQQREQQTGIPASVASTSVSSTPSSATSPIDTKLSARPGVAPLGASAHPPASLPRPGDMATASLLAASAAAAGQSKFYSSGNMSSRLCCATEPFASDSQQSLEECTAES